MSKSCPHINCKIYYIYIYIPMAPTGGCQYHQVPQVPPRSLVPRGGPFSPTKIRQKLVRNDPIWRSHMFSNLIGSMGLGYIPTWMAYIYGLHVGKYTRQPWILWEWVGKKSNHQRNSEKNIPEVAPDGEISWCKMQKSQCSNDYFQYINRNTRSLFGGAWWFPSFNFVYLKWFWPPRN